LVLIEVADIEWVYQLEDNGLALTPELVEVYAEL
jgi:hypothetical protein